MNKIITLAIAATVGILMTGALLVPIINDAVSDQKTLYNNEANGRYSELIPGSDAIRNLDLILYVADFSDPTLQVTRNGETSTMTAASFQGTLIMSDKINIRWDPGNGNVRISSINDPNQIIAQTDLTAPLTVEVDNGVVTVTDSGTYSTIVTPTSWIFIPDNNGTWETVTYSANDVYINNLDQVFFSTIISTGGIGFMSGNGGVATDYQGNQYTYTFEGMRLVNGFSDLYKVNMPSLRFGNDFPTNTDGSPIVPFQIIVPRSVTAHTQSNLAASAILSAIPVFVLLSLAVSAVFVIKRD